jgi:hypothetical protein
VGLQLRLLMPSVPGDGTRQSVGSIILLPFGSKAAAVVVLAFCGEPNMVMAALLFEIVVIFTKIIHSCAVKGHRVDEHVRLKQPYWLIRFLHAGPARSYRRFGTKLKRMEKAYLFLQQNLDRPLEIYEYAVFIC